ncbi:PAS domain S-box protein [Pseudomonadota bacterium]
MSVRFKFIFPLVLMAVVFFVVVNFFVLPDYKNEEVSRVTQERERIVNELSVLLYPYVKTRDVDAIGALLSAYNVINGGVLSVVVTDNLGQEIYQYSGGNIEGQYSSYRVKIAKGSDYVGDINISVNPLSGVILDVEQLYAVEYLFFGMFLMLVLLVVVLQHYHLKKPIESLLASVNAIAYGDFDADIKDLADDEFSELAGSIRIMRNNITAFQRSLKEKTIRANELAESLFESERKTKSIVDNVAHGIVVLNGLGGIESVNKALCDMLGYSEGELISQNLSFLLPADDRKRHDDGFIFSYISSRSPSVIGKGVGEVDVQKKGGDIIVADIAITEMTFARDRFFNVVIADATERKLAEERLRTERDRAQRYLDTVDVMVVALDLDGKVKLINRKGCEVIEISEKDALGIKWSDLCVRDMDVEEFNRYFQAQIKGEEDTELPESILLARSGQEHIISWRHSLLLDQDGNVSGMLYSGTDVTDAKKAEKERLLMQQQLQQAQKMQAIGQLTGGIAHDFNNIVASIMGNTELLMLKNAKSEDSKQAQYLKNIYQSSERAKDLVTKMLAFSRGQELEAAEPILIESAVNDIINILRSVLPATISISSSYGGGGLAVLASHIDLQQIVMNLCINARDAMDGVGTLNIEVNKIKKETAICSSCHDVINGDYVVLSVSDTGSGISENNLSRLFEPFFTTKDIGKGTGMGLSVVHGIVHDLGGHILVTSEEGQGTRIAVYLRASEPADNNVEEFSSQRCTSKGNGAKVLVVDDEPLVRDYIGELLGGCDFHALLSADPLEALEIVNREKGEIDAIITDQSMPGMTGVQFSEIVSRKFPDIPIVLCTGYRDDILDPDISSAGVRAVLNKPMKGEEILSVLNKVIVNDGGRLVGNA